MGYSEVFAVLEENPRNVYEEAVKILCKIADNILNAPSDLRKRTLQKNNATISSKVLSVKGGAECLKLMGFLEHSSCFTMPTNVPIKTVDEFKKAITSSRSGIEKKITIITSSKPSGSTVKKGQENEIIKKVVLPPLTLTFTNPFLRKIEICSHSSLRFEDLQLQKRVRRMIPVATLEENAQKRLRVIQEHIKKNKLEDPEMSIQDTMILELLQWFKDDFFDWVDIPSCSECHGDTVYTNLSTDSKDLLYTSRVEVYHCKTCDRLEKFPRYTDLNILLETRRGRCGEWADVFTLCCRSLGWDTRLVSDETDHVWTEVYSWTQKRWLHCDACENALDTPLMYETGWRKQVSYVMAYSGEEVQDVTWRYSADHRAARARRRQCEESELLEAVGRVRGRLQAGLSEARRAYLARRTAMELAEFLTEKKPNDEDNKGRSSGSEIWRLARGEIQKGPERRPASRVWRVNADDVIDDSVSLRYSVAQDRYECVTGDRVLEEVAGWSDGANNHEGVFRKVEKDWKMSYLARKETIETGTITWRIDIGESEKKVQKVLIEFNHETFENGSVAVELIAGASGFSLPKGEKKGTFLNFAGCRSLIVKATLSGGKGDLAWQHAQLFRQSTDSSDFPFAVTLLFK